MRVFVDLAACLSILDHRKPDAVFDTLEWIEKFTLGIHGGRIGSEQAVDPDHRGVANSFDDVIEGSSNRHSKLDPSIWNCGMKRYEADSERSA